MVGVRATRIDRLVADLRDVPVRGARQFTSVVRKNTEAGNRLAQANARRTAGAHGKHYPNAFTAELLSPFVGEYGPDASRPQGGMSFEFGSRNQPPHLDLAKSADVQGPLFAKDIGDVIDGLFW